MARSPLLPLADKAFGGGLLNYVRARKDDGLSWEDISKELHAKDISVSAQTLKNWCTLPPSA